MVQTKGKILMMSGFDNCNVKVVISSTNCVNM